jgi:Flp pilus assembly protein TadG
MPSSAGSEAHCIHQRDGGQAAVELALCLPVVFVLLLGIVQVAVVVRDELLVQHAAREGARSAAVAADGRASASAAALRVLEGSGLTGVGIASSTVGSVVRVEVRATTRTDVPLIGALLGDVDHGAAAVMTLEPP